MHTGTFGRGDVIGRSERFTSIRLSPGIVNHTSAWNLLGPVGPIRQPFSFYRAWNRLGNVLASTPRGRSVTSCMEMRGWLIVVEVTAGIVVCNDDDH